MICIKRGVVPRGAPKPQEAPEGGPASNEILDDLLASSMKRMRQPPPRAAAAPANRRQRRMVQPQQEEEDYLGAVTGTRDYIIVDKST